MMATKKPETPEHKAERERLVAEAGVTSTPLPEASPESPVKQLARLEGEHEAKMAEEDKHGCLTGDIAMARNERARIIEQVEREMGKK
jgi:hypothetical protein